MAVFAFKDADIDVGGNDISGDANSCELTVDVGIHETTAFQDDWDTFVDDIASWSLSISGFADMTATGMEALFFAFVGQGEQDLILHPQGAGVGSKYTGKVILKSHAVGGALKGACPYSCTWQGSGELTRGPA